MTLTERDKKMLIALGVVAALAVIYLFFFVLPGDGDSGETAEPVPTDTAVPTISPSPTETPRPTSPPIDLVGDRDPVSIPPGLSPSPTGGGVSPTSTTTPTTTTPTFTHGLAHVSRRSPDDSPPARQAGRPDHDRGPRRGCWTCSGTASGCRGRRAHYASEGAIFDDNFKLEDPRQRMRAPVRDRARAVETE
jgi:hypothetical protein